MGEVEHFQQLHAWQEAHKLVLAIYRITQGFPSEERFGLVSQMRRAAVSIPATDEFLLQAETVGRILNGLIASTERRQ